MFKATVRLGSITEVITWTDGKLEGGDFAAYLREELRRVNGAPVGPIHYYTDPIMEDPLAVLLVMRDLFDEVVDAEGDVPEAPKLPPGAIG